MDVAELSGWPQTYRNLPIFTKKDTLFAPHKFVVRGQTLWLSPARCIYWEEENALILSDLHFGKSGHFRKEGIGIPQNIFKEDLQRLFTQIQFFSPKKVLIAGDMFHSRANKEIDLFTRWRNDIAAIEIHLIKGNHDILADHHYQTAGITIIPQKLLLQNFCFTHDYGAAGTSDTSESFTFSGHLHPGIKVNGSGRQSIMLACFYFSDTYAVLPAFSLFTGLYKIRPSKKDTVFALIENRVVKLSN